MEEARVSSVRRTFFRVLLCYLVCACVCVRLCIALTRPKGEGKKENPKKENENSGREAARPAWASTALMTLITLIRPAWLLRLPCTLSCQKKRLEEGWLRDYPPSVNCLLINTTYSVVRANTRTLTRTINKNMPVQQSKCVTRR
jgi:hypothetical protein